MNPDFHPHLWLMSDVRLLHSSDIIRDVCYFLSSAPHILSCLSSWPSPFSLHAQIAAVASDCVTPWLAFPMSKVWILTLSPDKTNRGSLPMASALLVFLSLTLLQLQPHHYVNVTRKVLLGPSHVFFPQPGMFFHQIFTWLRLVFHFGLCFNITSAERTSLTTTKRTSLLSITSFHFIFPLRHLTPTKINLIRVCRMKGLLDGFSAQIHSFLPTTLCIVFL